MPTGSRIFEKRQFVLEAEQLRQPVGAEHEKIEILEDAEQPEMGGDREAEHQPLPLAPCRGLRSAGRRRS